MQPAQISRLLIEGNLRMGSVEELISYMGVKRKKNDEATTIGVFSVFGPNRKPCFVLFRNNGYGETRQSILHNDNTSKWMKGTTLLVFPIKQ